MVRLDYTNVPGPDSFLGSISLSNKPDYMLNGVERGKIMVMRTRFRLGVIVFTALGVLLAFGALQAQVSEKQQKIMKRLQDISEEIKNCGNDKNCIQQKIKEFKVLSHELGQAGDGTPGMPSHQDMQGRQAYSDAVEAEPSHRKHEACYNCEVARADVLKQGFKPRFICVPAFFHVKWELNEQRNRTDPRIGPSSWVRCKIEERFKGCLILVYKDHTKRQLVSLRLQGTHPVDPSKASIVISQIATNFGLWKPSNFRSGAVYSTVSTSNPGHFQLETIEERGVVLDFSYDISPRFVEGKVLMPEIRVRDDLFVPEDWELIEVYDWGESVEISLDNEFTCDEVLAAYQSKKILTRTLHFQYQWFEGSGKLGVDHIKDVKATMLIKFDSVEEPGLRVSPSDGLIASGPDKKGRYKPDHKIYTLTNTGEEQLRYNLRADRDWVTLSPKGRILSPKAGVQVTVGVNASKAKGLGPDQRRATVNFINVTNGQGNTTRPVKLVNREEWRVTWVGWDTLYFGDKTLAGGIKTYWQVRVDFTIEDDKYKEGHGTARFQKFEPHSHPPGVYDCEPMKGWAHDAQGNKHPVPYIDVRKFNVPGWCTSASATLQLPKENWYLVDYYCVMDTDHAKVALGKRFGKLGAKDKVKVSSKYKSVDWEGRLLPSARQKIPLQDGWNKSYGRTKSMDAHFVEVRRIE